MNILAILRTEQIIHKDIKPGNIIVGDDLYNFPENIKIIDLGFSFEYKSLSEFILTQSIHLSGDVLEELNKPTSLENTSSDYEDAWEEFDAPTSFKKVSDRSTSLKNTSREYEDAREEFDKSLRKVSELFPFDSVEIAAYPELTDEQWARELWDTKCELFSLDYYQNWDAKYNLYEIIFNVITNVATPLYAAPEYDIRLKIGSSGTFGSLISPDLETNILEIRRDIPQYIINNQFNINYTELAELYVSESKIDDGYFDLIEEGIVPELFIPNLIKYNEQTNTKYNLFELIYLMANGLTGPEPIIYKYDLYAFGLILRKLVDVYTEALNKNILFDPRKHRAKTKKKSKKKRTKKSSVSGGSILETTKENFKDLSLVS